MTKESTNNLKISFCDFGFYYILIFYLIFLPLYVWNFNPDELAPLPIELAKNGVTLTMIIGFFYWIINKLIGIPLPIKKIFSSIAILLFLLIVFLPTKPGDVDGINLGNNSITKIYMDLFKYIILTLLIGFIVFTIKNNDLMNFGWIIVFIISFLLIVFILIKGISFGIESRKLLWDRYLDDQTNKNAFIELGTDKNIIIIVWDALQGMIAEQVIKEKSEYKNIFEGFILFPKAISAAPQTVPVLPTIFSGKIDEKTAITVDQIRKVMCSDSFFLDAKKNGFKIAYKGVLPSINIGGARNFKEFTKFRYKKNESSINYYLNFLSISHKRITPIILQNLFTSFQKKVKSISNNRLNKENIESKYSRIVNEDIKIIKFKKGNLKNKLMVLHSYFTHEPYLTEKGLGYDLKHAKKIFKYALIDQSKKLIDKLKDLKIYSNSLIVIMADHGARNPLTSLGIENRAPMNKYSSTGRSMYPAGAYNPLFLIKLPNSTGQLKTNNSPFLLTDLRGVIDAYMKDNKKSKEMICWSDLGSERKFVLLIKSKSKKKANYGGYFIKKMYGSLEDIPDSLQ